MIIWKRLTALLKDLTTFLKIRQQWNLRSKVTAQFALEDVNHLSRQIVVGLRMIVALIYWRLPKSRLLWFLRWKNINQSKIYNSLRNRFLNFHRTRRWRVLIRNCSIYLFHIMQAAFSLFQMFQIFNEGRTKTS